MNDQAKFSGAGRVSYALLDAVAQDNDRMPLRLRIFMAMLADCDSHGQLRRGITRVIKGLSVNVNNSQAYQAVHQLIERDWIRRHKGRYYVNPVLFWRGRVDVGMVAFKAALRNYQSIEVDNGRVDPSE